MRPWVHAVFGAIIAGCGGTADLGATGTTETAAPSPSAETTIADEVGGGQEVLTAPALVGNGGGVVVSADDGLVLNIPSTALTEAVEITIERVTPADEWILVEYELGPDGLEFLAPVAATVRYGELPEGVTASDLEVVHVSSTEEVVVADPEMSADGLGFVVELLHFSRLVVRIPEMRVAPAEGVEPAPAEGVEPVLTGVQEGWPIYQDADGVFTVTVAVTYSFTDDTWHVYLRYDQDFNEPVQYGNFGEGSTLLRAEDFLGLERGTVAVSGQCLFAYNGQTVTTGYKDVSIPFSLQSRAGEPPRAEDVVQVTLNPEGSFIVALDNEDYSACPIFDEPVTVPIVMEEAQQFDVELAPLDD